MKVVFDDNFIPILMKLYLTEWSLSYHSPMQFVCLSFYAPHGSGVLPSSIFVAVGTVWCLRQAGGVV